MTNPQYRAVVQDLAASLVPALPADWTAMRLRATFISTMRTRTELWYVGASGTSEKSIPIVTGVLGPVVDAAHRLRDGLIAAGSPECRAFVFSLARDGKSNIEVEY